MRLEGRPIGLEDVGPMGGEERDQLDCPSSIAAHPTPSSLISLWGAPPTRVKLDCTEVPRS